MLRVGFVAAMVLVSVPRSSLALYRAYFLDADNSVRQAVAYLNSQTPMNALIESYDSELYFFLRRRYHYPPDAVHVQLIRRTFLYDDAVVLAYEPLAADPDYLVVGPHSRRWRLYDETLASGAFRLVANYSRYQIYRRIR